MIELIQRLNDIIYKINDKLNIHTKLVDPSSELMPLYSMLSIIVSIFLIILGIKVRKIPYNNCYYINYYKYFNNLR